jgi:hypothetical protein
MTNSSRNNAAPRIDDHGVSVALTTWEMLASDESYEQSEHPSRGAYDTDICALPKT